MAKEIKVKGFPKPFTFDDEVTEDEIDRVVNEEIIPNRETILAEGMQEDIKAARKASFNEMSGLEKFIAGTGRGLMDVYEGVGQLALEAGDKMGFVEPETVQKYTQGRDEERQHWDELSEDGGDGLGRFVGGAIPFAAIPGGAAARGAGMLKSAGLSTLAGAAQGFTEFVPEDESRVANTSLGALFGLGGAGAGHFLKKGINAVRGRLAGSADEVAKLADQHGVSATAGDVSNKPGLRRVEQALEYIPFLGMTKHREKQAGQIKDVLEKTKQKYKDELPSVEYEHLKRVETKAKAGDKAAIRTMNEIIAAGDDPDKIIKASASLKLWRAREKAKNLYDQAEAAAGNAPVAMTATQLAVKKGLIEAKNGLLKEPEVIRKLNELSTSLKKKTDYQRARKGRSDLGERIKELAKAGKMTEARALTEIKDGIEADLQFFGNQSPSLRYQQQVADDFYAKTYSPMRDYNKNFINKGETDDLTRKGLNVRSQMASQKFYSSLDEKGRAAVRHNIVDDAWNKAFDSAKGTVSPTKFATHIQKLENSTGFFFRGQDKQELDGLVKLMKHLERAGQYAENPATGDRFTRLASWAGIGGTAAVSWKAALAGYMAAGGTKALLTTKAGRNLLLASSQLDPSKGNYDKFAQVLVERLPSLITSMGLEPMRDTQ